MAEYSWLCVHTWPMKVEVKLDTTEMGMSRWISGFSLKETNKENVPSSGSHYYYCYIRLTAFFRGHPQ